MKSRALDSLATNTALEIERFAAFDHPTRRFIAYAMYFVPGLVPPLDTQELTGNQPVPFTVPDAERIERLEAYRCLFELRACTAKGREGHRERRLALGGLLGMARVDLRWKRLTGLPQFIFCYGGWSAPRGDSCLCRAGMRRCSNVGRTGQCSCRSIAGCAKMKPCRTFW